MNVIHLEGLQNTLPKSALYFLWTFIFFFFLKCHLCYFSLSNINMAICYNVIKRSTLTVTMLLYTPQVISSLVYILM